MGADQGTGPMRSRGGIRMAGLRTMHDIRTLRSVVTRGMPTSEGAVFLQLHRLASEKLRLDREAELWMRKKERIEKRLAEIQQQMDRLRQVSPGVPERAEGQRSAWRQVDVEY